MVAKYGNHSSKSPFFRYVFLTVKSRSNEQSAKCKLLSETGLDLELCCINVITSKV